MDAFFTWLWSHLASIVGFALGLVLCLRLLRERQRPSVTFAWLLAMFSIPYVGVPLYILFGGRKLRGLRASAERRPTGLERGIEALLAREGQPAARDGNELEWLFDGVAAYERLLATLSSAQRSIDVATFILARDETGREVLELLVRKARAGVRVRVLLDAFGSLGARGKFLSSLRAAGGRVASSLPILPLHRRWSLNLRNHRKLVVVDDETVWTGGMNLAGEYLGRAPRDDRWIDASVLVRGPLVADLAALFARDWSLATGEPGRAPAEPAPLRGQARVELVTTGPDVPFDALADAVLAAIGDARERIWLATPYFVPDEVILRQLSVRARLGCDVRLFLPRRSNHRLADLARGGILNDLHDAGVQVRLVPERMLHAKVMVFDESLAVFGSANLDLRSLYLNFELCLFLYSAAEVRRLARWMSELERGTVPFTRREPRFLERTLADLSSLVAPLL